LPMRLYCSGSGFDEGSCFLSADIAAVNAQAIAEAGDIVVGAVVQAAAVGAGNVQAVDGLVVQIQSAAAVVGAHAAKGAPCTRLTLHSVEGAFLDGAEVPLVSTKLLVHALLAVLVVLCNGLSQMGQAELLAQLFNGVSLDQPAFLQALFNIAGQVVQNAALEVVVYSYRPCVVMAST